MTENLLMVFIILFFIDISQLWCFRSFQHSRHFCLIPGFLGRHSGAAGFHRQSSSYDQLERGSQQVAKTSIANWQHGEAGRAVAA